MLQPEEIQKVTFEQSVFSGYKKEDVDAFLDKVYSEYSRLYKENAELVEKLKICISKIEEYREDEKFLKSAIVNAQKLNETAMQEIALKKQEVEESARKQAEDIVSQAKAEAARLTEENNRKIADFKEKSTREYAQQQLDQANAYAVQKREYEALIAAKQDELGDLQDKVDMFKTSVLTIFEQQIKLLNKLPETDKAIEIQDDVAESTTAMENEAEIENSVATQRVVESATEPAYIESAVENVDDSVEEIAVSSDTELVEESESKDLAEKFASVDEPVKEAIKIEEPVETEGEAIEDEYQAEQIDIEELIAVKPSPVEPAAPELPTLDSTDDAVEDEPEEEFHLFGAAPLVFPTDIPEDDEDEFPAVTEKGSRFKKKLKFGVDFDVKKDK